MTDKHPIGISLGDTLHCMTVESARKLVADIQQQLRTVEQPQYAILNDERRLTTGGPLNNEYYGPSWDIGTNKIDTEILVPDPGDGSSKELAKRIVELLNHHPLSRKGAILTNS